MSAFCPRCGYDIEKDVTITVGRVTYDPVGGLIIDGEVATNKRRISELVGNLLKAEGAVTSTQVLCDRMGWDDPNNLKVAVCHARHLLDGYGLGGCVENIWGRGYRWREAA